MSTCCTIHKVQALTLTNIVWILSDLFQKGLAYVASSRVKSFSGLYLVPHLHKKNITKEDFNKWNLVDIHNMYTSQRLHQRLTARKLAENYVDIYELPSLDDIVINEITKSDLTRCSSKTIKKFNPLQSNNITDNIIKKIVYNTNLLLKTIFVQCIIQLMN